MSASLVGSEMCIRDSSPSFACCVGLRPTAAGRSRGVSRSAGRSLGEGRGCLLYTSDAADDM
eukprot:1407778-Alexandrium_andersonii.AAC.1